MTDFDCDRGAVAAALLIALALVLIAALAWASLPKPKRRRQRFVSPRPFYGAGENSLAPDAVQGERAEDALPDSDAPTNNDPAAWAEPAERRSVHAALSRMYTTADADPLVTGQLYEFSDGVRNVYSQRTSHGDVRGLTEYSSSGGPGDVGVDVGPNGLYEYGGDSAGYDDGIPEAWRLPSTPVRWYRPKQRDYYGPEGPTVYSEGLYAIAEPDHDPLVN
ncbi:MAG: hypothetical protein WC700_04130 [Gemmatimonadaceae bacterium]|jgi:hypothetical protein